MPHLKAISLDSASKKNIRVLKRIEKQLGMIPNLIRVMANSESALQGFSCFHKLLSRGSLSPRLREKIALAVASANDCDYCMSAHTALLKLSGVRQEEVAANLNGSSSDPKTSRALHFAQSLVKEHGRVDRDELSGLKRVGFSDAEITEIVAAVSINIFVNYLNHISEPEADFPADEYGVHELRVGNW